MKYAYRLLFLAFGVVYAEEEKSFFAHFRYQKGERPDRCADRNDWDASFDEYNSTNVFGPLIPCHIVPPLFHTCLDPTPLYGFGQTGPAPANDSYHNEGKCLKFGGYRYEDIEMTTVKCRVLGCIECYGPRIFLKKVPCVHYTGHFFLTTLLYSIFLGIVAVDRFCLGYSAMAVGKLMTLGGFGVWWIIDIFLLVTGNLGPADDSSWEKVY